MIEVIENLEIGKREFKRIIVDGNKFEGKGDLKVGDSISGVWRKDWESFFKD